MRDSNPRLLGENQRSLARLDEWDKSGVAGHCPRVRRDLDLLRITSVAGIRGRGNQHPHSKALHHHVCPWLPSSRENLGVNRPIQTQSVWVPLLVVAIRLQRGEEQLRTRYRLRLLLFLVCFLRGLLTNHGSRLSSPLLSVDSVSTPEVTRGGFEPPYPG